VLVELGVVEQRYRAVLEVLDEGIAVTEVARRYGVARQTVHQWLARYANDGGLGGLADRSSRPDSCPHQMPAVIEAQIVGIRRGHPGWGPSRILFELERAGADPLPGRSAVTGRWCATTWSRAASGAAGGRITAGGSAALRCSCGRWT
jgi:hypothetical protein